jgi:hypothetical protein
LELCADVKLGYGWVVEALDYAPSPASVGIGGADWLGEWPIVEIREVFTPIWFIRIKAQEGTCNVTGEPLSWTGRKWYVSQHSTDSEVLQTILKAYLTALEHEAREMFLYRGQPIFDPHFDVEALHLLRVVGMLDTRQQAVPASSKTGGSYPMQHT